MTNRVVGVTGLQAGWSPSPGVSVAHSLHLARTNGMKIIGIDYHIFCTGLYLGIFDESHLLPPLSKPEFLLKTLSRIQGKTGLNVIIPNLDTEQEVYSRLQLKLKEKGIHLLIPNEKVIKLRSKLLISTFARKHNFLVPSTFPLNSHEDLSCLPQETSYPLIIKGHFCDAYPVASLEEAVVYISKLEKMWGWPVLIQNYIDGEEIVTLNNNGTPIGQTNNMLVIGASPWGNEGLRQTVRRNALGTPNRVVRYSRSSIRRRPPRTRNGVRHRFSLAVRTSFGAVLR